MLELDFEIEYRAGTKLAHVDALSRNPVESSENADLYQDDIISINLIKIDEGDWVLSAQLTDDRCKYLHEVLSRESRDKEEREIHRNFKLKNNRVYRIAETGLKWVVPKRARKQVITYYHDALGHFGFDKTFQAVSKNYWFAGMRRYIKRYINSCLACLYNKQPGGKKSGMLNPIEKVAIPLRTLHIDHLGPFVKSHKKNAYLIVAVDAFTKYVFMKAVS